MRMFHGVVRAFLVCVVLASASPVFAAGKKVVLSQAFQSMLYLPLYVAIDQGFFAAQGLDLAISDVEAFDFKECHSETPR